MRYVVNELGLHYLYRSCEGYNQRSIAMEFPYSVLATCSCLSAGLSLHRLRIAESWSQEEKERILSAAHYYVHFPHLFPMEARCMAVSSALMQLSFSDKDVQLLDMQQEGCEFTLVFGRLSSNRQQLLPLSTPAWICEETMHQWREATPVTITLQFNTVDGLLILWIDGMTDGMAWLEEDQWMDIVIQSVSEQVD